MKTSTIPQASALPIRTLSAALALALAGTASAAPGTLRPGANPARAQSPSLTALTHDFAHFRATMASVQAAHAAAMRPATTRSIQTLADSGSGSLREALATAADGDVIDLRKLRGRLTLSESLTTTANVTIKGPGRDLLTIDGARRGRVITSSGSLNLSDVSIANGAVINGGGNSGGCMFVTGDLTLQNATISGCAVGDETTEAAYGGAIAVGGNAYFKYTTVRDSSATAYKLAMGGGVIASGDLVVMQSTISGNQVHQVMAPEGTPPSTDNTFGAAGGGLVTPSNSSITYLIMTNVTGNTITSAGGNWTYDGGGTPVTAFVTGRAYGGGSASAATAIAASTVSGNSAQANGQVAGGGAFLMPLPPPPPAPRNPALSPTMRAMLGWGVTGSPTYSMVKYSEVSGNSVTITDDGTAGGNAVGGGIITLAPTQLVQSSVNNNSAVNLANADSGGAGGGVMVRDGSLTVQASTISGNTVSATGIGSVWGGGIGTYYGIALQLVDSTVSGNQATAEGDAYGGGIAASAVTFSNSTIAFNQGKDRSGGVILYGNGAGTKTIQSTIIANNSCTNAPEAADLFGPSNPTVDGDHNIVIASNSVSWTTPPLTSDPMLLALAFNGGPTRTHALAAASPAIDAGSNPLALTIDQRGYARVVGPGADIGAFELDSDRIFTNGFDARLGGP
ncbi:MAG: hypothetical protein K8F35_04220 [Dokdonella sp.]|uniref:choice-of-anchor Q domain-containing protein n=1 Tax=Dokdonella sp. TaxID=2291710 RepID=UPI0025BCFD7F|nr:choice-of-anchor Q domain-containing protein [Dokdonella sp.]MBZ0222214.1 hypothetical protein [Dokdonella sp.]